MVYAKDMQQIQFRSGEVTFPIPADWKVEVDQDGGGIFFDDRSNSGTLRLTVLTAKSPRPVSPKAGLDLLPSSASETGILLANGTALSSSINRAREDGQAITVFKWTLARAAPPQHARLALFTYTILSSLEADKQTLEEFAVVEAIVRNTIVSNAVPR